MKKLIVSAVMCVALMASTTIVAQDSKTTCPKSKTECTKTCPEQKTCKDKKDCTQKPCDKPAEKKSCCTADKKATNKK